ncbi:MAG: AAA family ATPase [Bdellovibrionales bacterium]|nr:AAA family ATPase [Bdellovibrionales bacterium]
MLKELKLSNFRLFDEEVTVRFRPITVLIGRNNSGKSSIIKFLLMLKQSLNKESTHFFNTENTGLGNFTNIKNSLTKKEVLSFNLTVTEKRSQILYELNRYIQNQLNQDIDQNVEFHIETLAQTPYQIDKEKERHEVMLHYQNKKWLIQKSDKYKFNFLDFSKELEEIPIDDLEEKNVKKNIINSLQDNIDNLRHLPPVRGNEKSIIITQEPSVPHVGQDGKYTLAHLQKIKNNSNYKNKYDFIIHHIQNVAGIDEIDFKRPESADISECFAMNKVTRAKTLIGNFGFGVSQCLPIFVQGAMMPQWSSLVIEQPEAQLHPTAQLEIGSFFAELWKKYQVGSIIETHSDNILLRLRRLIAKDYLQPEDVSVAFFNFDSYKQQPIIKNLNIEKDGSIKEGDLPAEFFNENFNEVLKIGAGE